MFSRSTVNIVNFARLQLREEYKELKLFTDL